MGSCCTDYIITTHFATAQFQWPMAMGCVMGCILKLHHQSAGLVVWCPACHHRPLLYLILCMAATVHDVTTPSFPSGEATFESSFCMHACQSKWFPCHGWLEFRGCSRRGHKLTMLGDWYQQAADHQHCTHSHSTFGAFTDIKEVSASRLTTAITQACKPTSHHAQHCLD